MDKNNNNQDWALILGASSGIGAACAKALAKKGINIYGLYLRKKQSYIDEVMDDPTAYEGELHVRGEVSIGSLETDNFSFSISGVRHVLHVDYSSTVIPDGFDEGNMIAIKGDLLIIDGLWVIEAHEIQTGFPSKYEASQ